MMAAILNNGPEDEHRRAAKELMGEEFDALEAEFQRQRPDAQPAPPAPAAPGPRRKIVSWRGECLYECQPFEAEPDATTGPTLPDLVRLQDSVKGQTWRLQRVPGEDVKAATSQLDGPFAAAHAGGHVYVLYRTASRHTRRPTAEALTWVTDQAIPQNVLESYKALRRMSGFYSSLELERESAELSFRHIIDAIDEMQVDSYAALCELRANARLASSCSPAR